MHPSVAVTPGRAPGTATRGGLTGASRRRRPLDPHARGQERAAIRGTGRIWARLTPRLTRHTPTSHPSSSRFAPCAGVWATMIINDPLPHQASSRSARHARLAERTHAWAWPPDRLEISPPGHPHHPTEPTNPTDPASLTGTTNPARPATPPIPPTRQTPHQRLTNAPPTPHRHARRPDQHTQKRPPRRPDQRAQKRPPRRPDQRTQKRPPRRPDQRTQKRPPRRPDQRTQKRPPRRPDQRTQKRPPRRPDQRTQKRPPRRPTRRQTPPVPPDSCQHLGRGYAGHVQGPPPPHTAPSRGRGLEARTHGPNNEQQEDGVTPPTEPTPGQPANPDQPANRRTGEPGRLTPDTKPPAAGRPAHRRASAGCPRRMEGRPYG